MQALQRREVAVAELVDPLGRRQVLQPVLAQVAQPVRARRAPPSRPRPAPARRGRRRRSAPPGGRRPRRTPPPPEAAYRCGCRCAPGSGPRQAVLASRGRRERARRSRKSDEEGVALRIHLDATVRAERVAQDAAMIRERLGISAAPSSCSSRVEPSTSVKRKVTVPEGRSRSTPGLCVRTRPASRATALAPPPAAGTLPRHTDDMKSPVRSWTRAWSGVVRTRERTFPSPPAPFTLARVGACVRTGRMSVLRSTLRAPACGGRVCVRGPIMERQRVATRSLPADPAMPSLCTFEAGAADRRDEACSRPANQGLQIACGKVRIVERVFPDGPVSAVAHVTRVSIEGEGESYGRRISLQ